MIWFAPFQGVGDHDDLIVRFGRPVEAPPSPADTTPATDEEPHVKAL